MIKNKLFSKKCAAYIISPFLTLYLIYVLTGCAVGPNFESPQLNLPKSFIGDTLVSVDLDSLKPMKWCRGFGDCYLDSIILIALKNNRNLQISKNNVEQAMLQYRNTSAALAPVFNMSGGGAWDYNQMKKTTQTYDIMATMNWEVDVFGGLRRGRESQAAASVSSAFEYNAVLLSLVSQIAQNYFSLLQYKISLIISEKSYQTRLKSYELMQQMFKYGSISMLDLNQSKSLMLAAKISVESFKTSITETNSTLSLLLGINPTEFNVNPYRLFSIREPNIPIGIVPAWVVDNRPDIMSAYYDVWSSSAKIGVAVSRRFPIINITAGGGVNWEILEGVSTAKPFVWSAGASIAQALLNFGTNKRNVKIARLANDSAVKTFEQTVLTAFSEVENALSQINTLKIRRVDYKQLVATNASINDMTNKLYKKGATDYLQVLDAERSYLESQLNYCNIIQQYLSSYVSLFKALGGY